MNVLTRFRIPGAFAALMVCLGAGTAAADFTVAEIEVADRKAVFATVESLDAVPARARIAGTVADLAADEGDAVSAGQVLARVEDPKLSLRLRAVDARVQSFESQRDLARIGLERATTLRQSGTASQAKLDEARTNLDVLERALAAERAERKVIEQQQAEGDVLAPVTGRVLSVPVTAGSVIQPGETVATVAAERYVLRLYLPERHARFIKAGDTVWVGAPLLESGETAAAPDTLAEGEVRQVYPELWHGRVVADVVAVGLGDYFVGERVRVYVAAGTRRTFVVPEDYLVRRYGLTFVHLAGDGEVVVQPGRRVDGGIELLSGVRTGDVLVAPQPAAPAKAEGGR